MKKKIFNRRPYSRFSVSSKLSGQAPIGFDFITLGEYQYHTVLLKNHPSLDDLVLGFTVVDLELDSVGTR